MRSDLDKLNMANKALSSQRDVIFKMRSIIKYQRYAIAFLLTLASISIFVSLKLILK